MGRQVREQRLNTHTGQADRSIGEVKSWIEGPSMRCRKTSNYIFPFPHNSMKSKAKGWAKVKDGLPEIYCEVTSTPVSRQKRRNHLEQKTSRVCPKRQPDSKTISCIALCCRLMNKCHWQQKKNIQLHLPDSVALCSVADRGSRIEDARDLLSHQGSRQQSCL